MTCYAPVTAWRSRDVNASGKRGLVFEPSRGLFASELKVPCNNCIGCRLDRARAWTTRLIAEGQQHERKVFLTLTYDDDHLPSPPTLVPDHLQLFWKRLRKQAPGLKIKYLACGEYGDKYGRPHYHAIVFGIDFSDAQPWSKSRAGHQIFTSEKLDSIWSHGQCFIGSVSADSAGYVARYVLKKVIGDAAEDHYKSVDPLTGEIYDRLPEFLRCSKGLGKVLFEENFSDIYPHDHCVVGGTKVPVPKYYDKLLDTTDPELLAVLKAKRKGRLTDLQKAKEKSKLRRDFLRRKAESTPERLKVREKVKKAQLAVLKRDLE